MIQLNYFDLQDILVNELFGGALLFFLIAIITIWVICLKSKTGMQVPMVLSFIFVGIMISAYLKTFILFWALFLLVIGFLLYYNISNILR